MSTEHSKIPEDYLSKILKNISTVYKKIIGKYRKIFNNDHYLPTKSHPSILINGFAERNLTFYFCHQYLSRFTNSIAWQEIPISGGRIDSIIIDKDLKTVFYIEAKRFYGIKHFSALLDDLDRLKNYSTIPLPKFSKEYHNIVVLLADTYYHKIEGKRSQYQEDKEDCYDKFFSGRGNEINGDRYRTELIVNKKPKDSIVKSVEKVNGTFEYVPFVKKIENEIQIKSDDYNIDNKKNKHILLNQNVTYNIYCGAWQIK